MPTNSCKNLLLEFINAIFERGSKILNLVHLKDFFFSHLIVVDFWSTLNWRNSRAKVGRSLVTIRHSSLRNFLYQSNRPFKGSVFYLIKILEILRLFSQVVKKNGESKLNIKKWSSNNLSFASPLVAQW